MGIPHPHCCIGKVSKIFWISVKIRGKYSIGGYPKVLGNLIPKFFGVKYHCKGIAYSTILCSSAISKKCKHGVVTMLEASGQYSQMVKTQTTM